MPVFPYVESEQIAQDDWQELSRSEIVGVFPAKTFKRDAQRSRPAVRPVLECALRQKNEARALMGVFRVDVKPEPPESGVQAILEDRKFYENPERGRGERMPRNYLNRTSNEALARMTCQSCACWLWRKDCDYRNLAHVPNKHLLEPKHHHPAHELYGNMLIVPEELEVVVVREEESVHGYFCMECLKQLGDEKLPTLSLSNKMWVGKTPVALQGLTVPDASEDRREAPKFIHRN